MTKLLRTQEYIDIVELDRFVHEEYDTPAPGQINSFHSLFSKVLSYPGQNEMANFALAEIEDGIPEEYEKYYSKEELEAYPVVVDIFKRLIADGHLPEQDEYNIYIWW